MNENIFIAFFCSILLLTTDISFASEQPASSFKPANPSTQKEIIKVLDTLNKAYLEENLKEALSIVANDKNVLFIGTTRSDRVKGIEALKEAFSQDFDNIDTISCKYSNLEITSNGKIALVAADFDGTFQTDTNETEEIFARQTLVLEKIEEKWLIIQSHFSFPVEMMQQALNSSETKKVMEKDIDQDLEEEPIENEHVGDKEQEEITDEKLIDEDT